MQRLILKKSNARRGKTAKHEGGKSMEESNHHVYDFSELSKEIGGLKRGAVDVEGYKPADSELQFLDANRIDHEDSYWLITTQPSQFLGARPDDDPDGWTECYITARAKRKILKTPGFPEPLPRPTQPDCFRVVDLPGKGRGVVATKDIKWGDLILAERALIIFPAGFPSAGYLNGSISEIPKHFTIAQRRQAIMMNIERDLDIMFKRMPEEYQKAFMELWNCHTEDGSGPLFGICRTNRLALRCYREPVQPGHPLPEKAGLYCGMFKVISRFNHSCGPNVSCSWDAPTFSMYVRATRDIKEGEELCISYVPDLLESTASRQRELRSYGFACACGRCSDATVSDARSKEINEIIKPGFMCRLVHGSDVILKQDIDSVRRAIQLLEEEGLQLRPEYGQFLSKMSQACGSVLNDEEGEQRYDRMHANHYLATKSGRNEED